MPRGGALPLAESFLPTRVDKNFCLGSRRSLFCVSRFWAGVFSDVTVSADAPEVIWFVCSA